MIRSKEVNYLVFTAVFALTLIFLAGAPKKGETARICMFILPMLLLLVLTFMHRISIKDEDWIKLLQFVFLQSVVMQSLENYVW